MFDWTSAAILTVIGLIAIGGLIISSGVRLGQFMRPLSIILAGVLGGNVFFVSLIVAARLPLAIQDYQEGAIVAGEILSSAFFYFSWFPILTPGFYLFGLLGALAAVSIYTVLVHWRRILE